jgi:hypothetical protein
LNRLIRNKSTGHFLTSGGSWSEDVSSALDFSDSTKAILEKQKLGLNDVELVFMMGDKPGLYDVTLPL